MPYLREFMANHDPNDLTHYGRRLQFKGLPGEENTFVSGGSGQLLTHAATKRLGEAITKDPKVWAGSEGHADMLTSKTLNKLGISAGNTLDVNKRNTFIATGLDLEHTMTRKKNPNEWLWMYSDDTREGMDCCATRWISTHYNSAKVCLLLHLQGICLFVHYYVHKIFLRIAAHIGCRCATCMR
jgi:hypothetical protein